MSRQNKFMLGTILLLLVLNISFYLINSKTSCESCVIEFKNTKVSGVQLATPINYTAKPQELYVSLLNGTCVITWDRVYGYRKG